MRVINIRILLFMTTLQKEIAEDGKTIFWVLKFRETEGSILKEIKKLFGTCFGLKKH